MNDRLRSIDPLRHEVPIVDSLGRPTPQFMRQWMQTRSVDEAVGVVAESLDTHDHDERYLQLTGGMLTGAVTAPEVILNGGLVFTNGVDTAALGQSGAAVVATSGSLRANELGTAGQDAAFFLDRDNHAGTQAWETIADPPNFLEWDDVEKRLLGPEGYSILLQPYYDPEEEEPPAQGGNIFAYGGQFEHISVQHLTVYDPVTLLAPLDFSGIGLSAVAPFVLHEGAAGVTVEYLDADTVDGQHGPYYRNASNINAGTLDDAYLSSNVALKNAANLFSTVQSFERSAANLSALEVRVTGDTQPRFRVRPEGIAMGPGGATAVDTFINRNGVGQVFISKVQANNVLASSTSSFATATAPMEALETSAGAQSYPLVVSNRAASAGTAAGVRHAVNSSSSTTVAETFGTLRAGPLGEYGIRIRTAAGGTMTEVLRLDTSTAADEMRLLLWDVTAGALVRVSRGATDSGGVGFRLLRIPN